MIIKNGLNVNFWTNDWTCRGFLNEVFLTIFILEVDKQWSVANFGYQNQEVWHWDISLMRHSFDSEIHIQEEFIYTIQSVFLEENSSNMAIWKHTALGKHSCHSLRRELVDDIPIIPAWKLMCHIPAILKIKSFI